MSKQEPDYGEHQPRMLSEYIENEQGPKHFKIRWVPLPPDVKHKVVRDWKDSTLSEQVYIKLGCPHCHEDIEFQYEAYRNASILRQLQEVLGELQSFQFGVMVTMTKSELGRKLQDVAERLSEALKRW